jgi:hypothetical protein
LDYYDEWRAAKDKADETGGEVSEALEPPDILDGYGGWYEDFWRLSTERQIGTGTGPIPASQIDRHIAGWMYEDAEVFEFCMRRMDEVYLMQQNNTEQPDASVSPRDAFRSATSTRRGR